MTTTAFDNLQPRHGALFIEPLIEEPKYLMQWCLHDVARRIQVERLLGIHVLPSSGDTEFVELRASQAYYKFNMQLYADYVGPSDWEWFRVLLFHLGCSFEIREEKWYILREKRWKKLFVPKLTERYPMDAYINDVIHVKLINPYDPKVHDTLDAAQYQTILQYITNTIQKYGCTFDSGAPPYLADIWLTIYGYRGKRALRDYLRNLVFFTNRHKGGVFCLKELLRFHEREDAYEQGVSLDMFSKYKEMPSWGMCE